MTVGGADILDNSSKLDEQFKHTKSKQNDKVTTGKLPRKILANSGQHPNIKDKSHHISDTLSKSLLKRTQRSNILLAASAGSLHLAKLDKVMATDPSKTGTQEAAFNLFTHQKKRQL